jgi:2-amino-4-ketopentanoate thiolase alpha subunit
MTKVKAGDWVRIHGTVLSANERAPQVPEDTKKQPLEIWQKGFLAADANVGDKVEVTTMTGRRAEGVLIEVNPHFELNYGVFRPELLKVGSQVRDLLFGEGS